MSKTSDEFDLMIAECKRFWTADINLRNQIIGLTVAPADSEVLAQEQEKNTDADVQ